MGRSRDRSTSSSAAFRVRERKDVDLILGQGMLAASWHAHTLNAPGKVLISSPEHDTPRRARAYLLTDQAVADTAAHFAGQRPELDEVSRLAIEERHTTTGTLPRPTRIGPDAPDGPSDGHASGPGPDGRKGADDAPEVILWAALSLAPEEGVTVPDLMDATKMSRPWVYQRLRELAGRGQIVQVSRGRWRTVNGDFQ